MISHQQKIRITRSVTIPDPVKLTRYIKVPEFGPRILFFSGGTALNPLSRALVRYTHNSIHLVTPFDSGGSSAKLRNAFQMPAVGDMRSRLMALADQSVKGNPEIYNLFAYRLPRNEDQEKLKSILTRMADGHHPLVHSIHDPMRKIVCSYITAFARKMPEDFDLRGASMGNLILAAGYFSHNRHIDPVIFLFSKLAEVRGMVRPIMNKYLHLVSRLENGQIMLGQHQLTGKETPAIESPVQKIFLSSSLKDPSPLYPRLKEKVMRLIQDAEIICYPMGSFYSSLVANLLPRGAGTAIAQNDCPKVYIPNTGHDPEETGTSLKQRVETLLYYLHQSGGNKHQDSQLLNFVLLDKDHGLYKGGVDVSGIEGLGVKVIEAQLVDPENPPFLNADYLLEKLLSMV
ncbi:GAK system CofD-like protein [Desulfonatronospira sp.]|uniref:GAK system CofD-like protein n=1 Tax=Desulfonatronospira sp. TaxID=1962951 RepID=UPI0025BC6A12|nr:GAK system CofD-like protein [Desulfonatronospira sp.]